MPSPLVSIIIPTYNEQESIEDCIKSVASQSYKNHEIIIIDDGSTDNTLKIISNFKFPLPEGSGNHSNFKFLSQKHLGPGPARNLGASFAKGDILVFVDADMTFDKDFIKDLIFPIIKSKKAIGTFSINELVANKHNIWSKCWNIQKNLPYDLMHPKNAPKEGPVFRAILKKEFEKVRGFDPTGSYTDDWSLSRKLGVKSQPVDGAIYYHKNPQNLKEIWQQARWVGKNYFIVGSAIRQFKSIFFYTLPFSIVIGLYKSLLRKNAAFLPFKIFYDFAIWTSVLKSLFGESKSK